MEGEVNFDALPTETKCQHKHWKARVSGYNDLVTLFEEQSDQSNEVFQTYCPMIKNIIVDANIVAQEKGLEAALAFIKTANVAYKICPEVANKIVNKCFLTSKEKIKELSLEILQQFIGLNKQDSVMPELAKGLENKSPKIVSTCLISLTNLLKNFGPKVIDVKKFTKLLVKLLEDRDKNVRDNAKSLTIEIYRWIKDAVKPSLANLKPLQLNELEGEFLKVKDDKPRPMRLLKVKEDDSATIGKVSDDDSNTEEIDPNEFLEEVEVLSRVAKNYFKLCESQKWQDRKEALQDLHKLVSTPKIKNDDFFEIVKTLKTIIAKDSNIIVVVLAVKCLTGFAKGLSKNFSNHANHCIPILLDKFREKKQNVVLAIRESIDACFQSVSLNMIQDDLLAALKSKNPQIKAESALFLSRCFVNSNPKTLNKKILQPICEQLIKTLNDTDPVVRDASAEAIGKALKVVEEKTIMPYLKSIEAVKLKKIKDMSESTIPKGETTQPSRITSAKLPERKTLAQKSSQLRPSSSISKFSTVKPGKPLTKKEAPATFSFTESELTDDQVEELMCDIVSLPILNGLGSSNWKERLDSHQKLKEQIQIRNKDTLPIQALVKCLAKNKGFRDSNMLILKIKCELLNLIIKDGKVSQWTLDTCLHDLIDKIGDPKVSASVSSVLKDFVETTNFEYVTKEILDRAFDQKNPKTQIEALNWCSQVLIEFGLEVPKGLIISNIKKSLASTNPSVRNAGISLIGTVYLYVGKPLRLHFVDCKAAILQQIDAEIDKNINVPAPVPRKKLGINKENGDDNNDENKAMESINNNGREPREDISEQITSSLLDELSDKNWKIRAAALDKIDLILTEAKNIKIDLNDLPQALQLRLGDVNKNLISKTLDVCKKLVNCLGNLCKQIMKCLCPSIISTLGDSKQSIRDNAYKTLNVWMENSGLAVMLEGELIIDALKTGNAFTKVELLKWLHENLLKIENISCSLLEHNIPSLLKCFEDKNAEVRKKAQECLIPFMVHSSYESMFKIARKMPLINKPQVLSQLENAKTNLPAKTSLLCQKNPPAPSLRDKLEAIIKPSEEIDDKPKLELKKTKTKLKTTALSLPSNSFKNIRQINEKTSKVLKWNFETPQDEHIKQLKDQMSRASWDPQLISNCFNSDFEHQLKFIDSLSQSLNSNMQSTIENLDLIFKWITLKFFENNSTVLVKLLGYVHKLFLSLSTANYIISDIEISAFLPYLLQKMGDSKDNVRKSVKEIMVVLEEIFPTSKIFAYLMQALITKNAHQKAECLMELGKLIESNGMSVCSPSPSEALTEIAKHASAKDSLVRNAALDCIVCSYHIEGENIFELIGEVSERDKTFIKEAIKRIPASNLVQHNKWLESLINPADSQFVLETAGIDKMMIEKTILPPKTFDVITSPMHNLPPSELPELIAKHKWSDIRVKIIVSKLSENIGVASFSFDNINEILNEEPFLLNDHINDILLASTNHLKNANFELEQKFASSRARIMELLINIVDALISLFQNKDLVTLIHCDVLQSFFHQLITTMAHCTRNKVQDNSPIYGRLNCLLLKILAYPNPTNIYAILIKIFLDYFAAGNSDKTYVDLVQKSLWKMMRMFNQKTAQLLDYSVVLININNFLKKFPSSYWKQQPSDVPLRTFKSLLYHLVQFKGKDILSYLDELTDLAISDMDNYIKRLLAKINQDSKALSNIFKKICSKESYETGISEFKQFKSQNQNFEIEMVLQTFPKASQEHISGVLGLNKPTSKSNSGVLKDLPPSHSGNNDKNMISVHLPNDLLTLTPQAWSNWLKETALKFEQGKVKGGGTQLMKEITHHFTTRTANWEPFTLEEMAGIQKEIDRLDKATQLYLQKFGENIEPH